MELLVRLLTTSRNIYLLRPLLVPVKGYFRPSAGGPRSRPPAKAGRWQVIENVPTRGAAHSPGLRAGPLLDGVKEGSMSAPSCPSTQNKTALLSSGITQHKGLGIPGYKFEKVTVGLVGLCWKEPRRIGAWRLAGD
jgi:hypothetical protein